MKIMIMKSRKFTFGLATQIMMTGSTLYWLSLQTLMLQEKYDMDPARSTFFYFAMSPFYVASAFLSFKLFKGNWMRRRSIIVVGFLISGVC